MLTVQTTCENESYTMARGIEIHTAIVLKQLVKSIKAVSYMHDSTLM